MRVMKPLLLMICLGVAVLFAQLAAKADDWNKATSLTFNQPVEIPGMALGPGTYVFKLLDSASDRDVVQIFNDDESRLYENVLAIPAFRSDPADKTVVTFEERAKGSPEAIHEWFYPGDRYGQEFVYPRIDVEKVAGLPAQKSNVPPSSAYVPPQTQVGPATPRHSAPASTASATPQNNVQIAQSTAPPNPASSSAATKTPAPRLGATTSGESS